MALLPEYLPVSSPLDPAEEPPGSLDPLGTLSYAERLADALLPGFTARMWRTRLLTFSAVAAAVADRTVMLMGSREDLRLEARLAFERLFVSAVVRMADRDPASYAPAPRRLPGRDLAKEALLVANEPLTRANFLKGQAVNGPFGVIARLARHLELIDNDGRMGRNAVALMMAWADDEQLPGMLDEDSTATRAGAAWMTDAVKRTVASVGNRDWPRSSHPIWEQLARHLRPDRIGQKEARVLLQLLEGAVVRRRVMGLLKKRIDVFRQASDTSERGKVERAVLLRGVRPELGDDATDRYIDAVIATVEAYEQTAGMLQQAFDGLVWALKERGGRSRPDVVLEDARLRRHLDKTCAALRGCSPLLVRAAKGLGAQPSIDPTQFIEPVLRLRDDAVEASASVRTLADAVLHRHERVQRVKAKAPWIDRESHWTLMPGENRVGGESPPVWRDTYLHPFRIANAYSLLGDLRQVVVKGRDAEE